jgi:hypothetical protein
MDVALEVSPIADLQLLLKEDKVFSSVMGLTRTLRTVE